MSIKQKITEMVLAEDKELEERLKAVRSRVLGTKDLDLIASYFQDLNVFLGKYEQYDSEERPVQEFGGRLTRDFFENLRSSTADQLKGKVINKESESGIQQATIEDVAYMQKDSIPDYEAGTLYIMPYHRKVLNHLFNVATGEKNAVVYVKQVRIDGKKYGPGQFTQAMEIGPEFDGKTIEDPEIWIE